MMNTIRTISFLSTILFLIFSRHAYSSEHSFLTITGNEITVGAMMVSTVIYNSIPFPLSKYMDGPQAIIETGGFVLNQMWNSGCINPTIALTNFMVNLGTRRVYRFFEQRGYIERENLVQRKYKVENENGVFEEREYGYLRSPLKKVFETAGPQAAAYLVTMLLVGC